jgi:dienelactone hydrolase
MRFSRTMMVIAALMASASLAGAAVVTREVEYRQGDTVLLGLMAWDGAAQGKRPGVLVVHEWWGHNLHARNQAKRLARAGYVAFALDLYGKGKVTAHPQEAQGFMEEAMRDPGAVAARFDAGLEELRKDIHVDPARISAIGYCFGGGVVMSQARLGKDLRMVASFHGMLANETPAAPGTIKARVLALVGGADPFCPPAQVAAFRKEMDAAGASYRVVIYPGAKHSFTNPDAAKAGMDQLAYNADADRRSWVEMLKLLREASR